MKKLNLDLDALVVQSFKPGESHSLRGTVRGAQDDSHTCRLTCPWCPSGPYCEEDDPSYPNGCSLPECGNKPLQGTGVSCAAPC